MKSYLVSSLVLLCSLAHADIAPSTALSFDPNGAQGPLMANCTWIKTPSTTAEAEMQIQWMSAADHAPVDPTASLTVTIQMPSMPSMNNAPTQIERLVDAQGNVITGAYLVRNMWFMMAGAWEVDVTLTNSDGSTETQRIDLQL